MVSTWRSFEHDCIVYDMHITYRPSCSVLVPMNRLIIFIYGILPTITLMRRTEPTIILNYGQFAGVGIKCESTIVRKCHCIRLCKANHNPNL